jgi:hypothetical protein
MEGKAIHYDGSVQANGSANDSVTNEPFVITDEMRNDISGNPYTFELNK